MATDPIPKERPPDAPAHLVASTQLPCSCCGWFVTPGYHSEASCHANIQQMQAPQERDSD